MRSIAVTIIVAIIVAVAGAEELKLPVPEKLFPVLLHPSDDNRVETQNSKIQTKKMSSDGKNKLLVTEPFLPSVTSSSSDVIKTEGVRENRVYLGAINKGFVGTFTFDSTDLSCDLSQIRYFGLDRVGECSRDGGSSKASSLSVSYLPKPDLLYLNYMDFEYSDKACEVPDSISTGTIPAFGVCFNSMDSPDREYTTYYTSKLFPIEEMVSEGMLMLDYQTIDGCEKDMRTEVTSQFFWNGAHCYSGVGTSYRYGCNGELASTIYYDNEDCSGEPLSYSDIPNGCLGSRAEPYRVLCVDGNQPEASRRLRGPQK